MHIVNITRVLIAVGLAPDLESWRVRFKAGKAVKQTKAANGDCGE